jgi:hypothetical protein
MNLSILTSIVGSDTIKSSLPIIYASHYNRWQQQNREYVFEGIHYVQVRNSNLFFGFAIPKLDKPLENVILTKIMSNTPSIAYYLDTGQANMNKIYYRTAGGRYFKIFIDRGFDTDSKSNKAKAFREQYSVYVMISVLSSNLWWWYYTLHFDMYNCKDYMMYNFKFNYDSCAYTAQLVETGKKLCENLFVTADRKTQQYRTTGVRKQLIFTPSKSKPIIDQIDTILAKHYGFTEEELDYIINYDIKYRMGIGGTAVDGDDCGE